MFKKGKPADRTARQRPPSTDAVFFGWQPMRSGEVYALYNITATGHPSHGSTVTGPTLRKLHLRVPGTPISKRRVKEL